MAQRKENSPAGTRSSREGIFAAPCWVCCLVQCVLRCSARSALCNVCCAVRLHDVVRGCRGSALCSAASRDSGTCLQLPWARFFGVLALVVDISCRDRPATYRLQSRRAAKCTVHSELRTKWPVCIVHLILATIFAFRKNYGFQMCLKPTPMYLGVG